MIEHLGSSGRSDTYRANCINGISRPKDNRFGGNKEEDRLHRAISDVAQSDTNQSNNQKQSTNPPTPKREQPSAIQPTAFRQSGVGEGESSVVDDERERMFKEFWPAHPDSCPRKVDRARCRQVSCLPNVFTSAPQLCASPNKV